MMRSMIVAFTDETACKYLDQQYMLGDNLCIVPVMNAAGTAEFYLQTVAHGQIYRVGRLMKEAGIIQRHVTISRHLYLHVQTVL